MHSWYDTFAEAWSDEVLCFLTALTEQAQWLYAAVVLKFQTLCSAILQLLLCIREVQKSTLLTQQCCQAKLANYSFLGLGTTFVAAESHVAMTLLTGCVQQLRHAAQPQQHEMQETALCTCNVCQMLQSFLTHPDQTQTLALGGFKEAQHGIR